MGTLQQAAPARAPREPGNLLKALGELEFHRLLCARTLDLQAPGTGDPGGHDPEIDGARLYRHDRFGQTFEHNLGVVENLSDTITVLARGEILAEGDYRSLSKNPDVIQAYMGSGHV